MSSIISSNQEVKFAYITEDLMEGGYYISFHAGEMPAYSTDDNNGELYKTIEEAKAKHSDLNWITVNHDSEEFEDWSGDVVAYSTF